MFKGIFTLIGRQSITIAPRYSSNYSAIFANDINQVKGSLPKFDIYINNIFPNKDFTLRQLQIITFDYFFNFRSLYWDLSLQLMLQ